MLLGESRTWDEQHRGIEKVEYIPTDSESIRGTRSENRPRAKVGVSGIAKPIIQWTLYSQRLKSLRVEKSRSTTLKGLDNDGYCSMNGFPAQVINLI
jgi:hypothetical protein